MKKLFLLFFISLLSYGAFAQDRFSVGLKAGYTSTKFSLENYDQKHLRLDDKDAQSGYNAGIFTRVRLFRGLSVQPELYYAKKKGEISYSGGTSEFPISDTSYVTSIESLELPLLLHLRLLDFDIANVYAVGGPVVAFNRNSSTEPEVDFVFENSNWTFLIGGGVEFWRMTADVRYEWSLSNVAKINDVGKFYNMLTFSIGFKIFGI